MPSYLSLRAIADRGVAFTCPEAIAIAQELIVSTQLDVEPTAAFGPPTLESVRLSEDGAVSCPGCVVTPAVLEIGILLHALLPQHPSVRVPGGVRYIIARTLLDVDVPFDSVRDLSTALARYESEARATVLRRLYARALMAGPKDPPVWVERRKGGPSVASLRRRLREADEASFVLLNGGRDAAPVATPVGPGTTVSAPAIPAPPAEIATPAPTIPFAAMPPIAALESVAAARVAQGTPSDETSAETSARRAWLAAAAVLIAFALGYGAVRSHRLASDVVRSVPLGSAPIAASAATQPVPPIVAREPAIVRHEPAITVPPSRRETIAAASPVAVRAVSASAGPTFSPSFAADGTALFFHSGRSADARSDLETASLAGDDLRVMKIVDDGSKNYHVTPSPDGSLVAFDSDRDGERGVYIANRDGSDVRRVSGSGYAAVPSWSPDATQLAFVRGESSRPNVWNLWQLTLATGASRRLTSFRFGQTWAGSWFPDGRHIAYTHEDQLFVRNLDTDATIAYPSPVWGRLVRTPAVSPDGRHIMFQVARAGAWLLDVADGSMRCVLADPTAEEFAWSPDGRRVAYHSRSDGTWGVWVMTPAVQQR